MTAPENQILNSKIDELSFSQEFKAVAKNHGYERLSELVAMDIERLRQVPGFNQRMLAEFILILATHELDHLIND